ncbi:MAG: PIN domain-containing protein [Chloroflexota bacterium]
MVLRHVRGPRCITTPAVIAEVGEYIPPLGARKRLNVDRLLAEFHLLPLAIIGADIYEPFLEEALRRIGHRDPDDWPTVALALALDLPIWSQDKDLAVAGLTVYTTGQLLDALRDETKTGANE